MSSELKTYAERYPHPGEQPPEPGLEPQFEIGKGPEHMDARTLWNARKNTFNRWVKANRKHLVARSLDMLMAEEPERAPVKVIAMVLGIEYLENDGNIGGGLFGGLF